MSSANKRPDFTSGGGPGDTGKIGNFLLTAWFFGGANLK